MKTAVFRGKLISADQFVNLVPHWRETGEYAVCPLCGNNVHPYGTHSLKVRSRFDHVDGVTWCPDSNTADPRYAALRPKDVDLEQAILLRKVFFTTQNSQRSFEFCRHLVGRGFDEATFEGLIAQADRINIWSYKQIPLWVVPYILLTLDTFVVHSKNSAFTVAFRFLKPAASEVDRLWLTPHECKLMKLFLDTEKPCLYPEGNPYPLSELFMWTAGNSEYM